MKKVFEMIGRIAMEMATVAYVFCIGALVNDLLWEFTSWNVWSNDEYGYMAIFAVATYMIVRYYATRKMKEFDEKYMPEMKRIIVVLEEYVKSNDKEDEA